MCIRDSVHITTEFKAHETTVIVGPSGSGKSTLLRSLNLLCLLYTSDAADEEDSVDLGGRRIIKKKKKKTKDEDQINIKTV
ncbi:arginine ABC transporter ATP-binding protein ArtP [Lactobacillus sp.] [Lactiplantibacillus mudanjiangensis]|nr:arginine ABC transporter ATP-binding protein ArtP [Lactobacillus sp.] [Lactiplantibacillus mudanjiangensis]